MFDYKFNIRMIKIFSFLTIIAFFMPFFAIANPVNPSDPGIIFSGLEISTGKIVLNEWRSGSIFGFAALIPSVILFVLSFFIHKAKTAAGYNILKTVFFIIPVFDLFAGFVLRYAFKAAVIKNIYEKSIASENFLESVIMREIAKIININIKFGFALYIIFNIGVFAFAAVNYFTERE